MYLALHSWPTRAANEGTLDGEVFIVTKAAQNVRLGLVEVQLFGEQVIKEHVANREKQVKAKMPDFDKEIAKIDQDIVELRQLSKRKKALLEKIRAQGGRDSALDMQSMKESIKDGESFISAMEARRKTTTAAKENWPASSHYFKDLPQPIDSTRTGSDGKFSLKAPRDGKFALAAHASRELPDSKEEYYWLIWVSLDTKDSKHLILGNHNLMISGSKESVISTKSE